MGLNSRLLCRALRYMLGILAHPSMHENEAYLMRQKPLEKSSCEVN